MTGPGSTDSRSGKMLASILGVCTMVPSLAAREAAWRADAEIEALLKSDFDNSENLASRWMCAVRARFLERGIVVSPAAAECGEARQ